MAAKTLVFLCAVAAATAIAVPVYPYTQATYAPTSFNYAAAPVAKTVYAAAPVAKTVYAAAPVAKTVYAAAPVGKVTYTAAPIAKLAYAEQEEPANYEFSYSVHDTQSGDIKQQHEQRSGNSLQGSYSLVQPDGVHRIVDYTSDHEHGFNAVVRYEGQPTEAPVKVAYAAPVAKVAYAAPVTKLDYAQAPVTKFAYAPAPVNYAAAPVTKVAYAPAPVTYAAAPAKFAYSAPVGHVTFSSPSYSYNH